MGLTDEVRDAIAQDPTYAAEYLRELSLRPLPVQLALAPAKSPAGLIR